MISNHFASLLKASQWFPTAQRMKSKTPAMTRKAVHDMTSAHLSHLMSSLPFPHCDPVALAFFLFLYRTTYSHLVVFTREAARNLFPLNFARLTPSCHSDPNSNIHYRGMFPYSHVCPSPVSSLSPHLGLSSSQQSPLSETILLMYLFDWFSLCVSPSKCKL